MINIKMQPTEVQKLSPKITVIGVGGAGGNAVNNMISSNLEGCEFMVCNTDAQALENSLCDHKIQLGANVTGGLGAGSKPEIGKAAAEESIEDLMKHLEGSNMAFVTAGMGGGTGTGAAPVIAKACREKGILTVGVVTKPFHFEGSHRMKMAEQGLEEMQDYVDTLIVIPNQNLFRVANEKTTFAEAFQMADGVLQAGVRGVTDLMVRPGLVNLDFADIRTAMLEMGKAMMGTGEAEGDKRAIEAAESAINNPLLDDVSMKGAHGVIINVTGGYDMTLFEADEACNRIRDEVDPDANIIFGATFDENLEGKMRVSIVATGIEREHEIKRRGDKGNLSIASSNTTGPNGDGGGNGGGKPMLERATPKTTDAVSPQAAAYNPVIHQVQQPAAPASFTALQSAASQPAPAAAQPQASATQQAQSENAPAAPEADMFDQLRFSAGEEGDSIPHNTVMRGTRFGDSFIPPRPMQAESFMDETQTKTAVFGAASTAGSNAALKLNPPRQPQPQMQAAEQPKRRTPSLFERITGTVQQTIDHAMGRDEHYGQRRGAPSMQGQDIHQNAVPKSPSQGTLNIDAPAGKPKQAEDEMDIPAFLRRQAN